MRRAYSEVDRLRFEEEAFRLDAGYSLVRAERDPKTGEYAYRVRVGRAPDPEWGVFIGEIAHNLRSALDGLVHQLVLDNGETPTIRNQFPVFLVGRTIRKQKSGGGPIPHFEGDGRTMLKGVSKEHQAKIERLQPYKRANQHGLADFGKDNYLYLLKELNNADKHRLIQVIGVKPGYMITGDWEPHGVYDVTGPRHVVLIKYKFRPTAIPPVCPRVI